VKLANLRIFEMSCRDIRYKGMGTTLVSVLVCGDKIYVGHVGDSRVYRLRENGIQQLTRDHSLLEDYKEAKPDMTEEEERNFPHKNVITRALGMRETVQVDIRGHQIKSGDIYILCSDGLSGMVPDQQILEVVNNAKSLERAVAELVDAANRQGGTDNITTLLLQCIAA
jgi:protein phosphatase